MPRLFVAIEFPAEIKLDLSGLCGGVAGVRWVAPENFHLTLRFIGEIDDPMAAGATAALRQVRMSRFSLTLAGVGQFGGHTLWVGVEPSPALLRLRDAVEDKLREIAPGADPRPYLPHVKLAHSRRRRSFRSFLAEHAGFRSEPFEVRGFSLIESHPGKCGTIYEHRADFALLAGAEPVPPAIPSVAPTGLPEGSVRYCPSGLPLMGNAGPVWRR